MTTIGFHCSHEQIAPGRLLREVQHAEQAGLTAAMSSDHLSPWSERQRESGFAWAFLGAALATTGLPRGRAIAHDQWRSNVHGPPVSWGTETVEAFDVMGEAVTPEQVANVVNVSSDPARHAAWMCDSLDQGSDEVYLHFVGQEQEGFIDTFGEHVLPQFGGAR